MKHTKILLLGIISAMSMPTMAQTLPAGEPADTAAITEEKELETVVFTAHATSRRKAGAENTTLLMRGELYKAACCNLGESFVTNPAVDVNYSDATTGAKQIRLLGLSGTYVQMMTESLPAFRGAAMPYALGYVPGPWMKSISVSKGNASVKNGYEAITGQIDIDYLKPEDAPGATFNIYGNSMARIDVNADANTKVGKHGSTVVLAHYENKWNKHDGNGDGFQDDPNVRQFNLQNRWKASTDHYIFHGGVSFLDEQRGSGQAGKHAQTNANGLWRSNIDTRRYEAFMKHAYILDHEHGTSLALLANASRHEQDATYGRKAYNVDQNNVYASLLYETHFSPMHELSAGLNITHDRLEQNYNLTESASKQYLLERENTYGGYAQYTFNYNSKLVAMAGLRADHSNIYGTFLTPRFHVKWMPHHAISLRLSAGKGYRSPHALAELNYLMASGRELKIDKPKQEEAWNYGISSSFYIPIGHHTLTLNAEYYYTNFIQQTLVDYDSDPLAIHITNLQGKSFSHTFQVDAKLTPLRGLDLTAAYRYNLVKSHYGDQLLWKPLQSRYKALLSASYKIDPKGLWQLDATGVVNGSGRLPQGGSFRAFPTLNAQLKRQFRHVEVYIGGENPTNYKQKNPILGAENPWGSSFEPTLIYAPISGAMAYAGIRINLGKHQF